MTIAQTECRLMGKEQHIALCSRLATILEAGIIDWWPLIIVLIDGDQEGADGLGHVIYDKVTR